MAKEHKKRGPEMVNADRHEGLRIFSDYVGVSYVVIDNDIIFRYNGQQVRMPMVDTTLETIDEFRDVVEMWRRKDD